MSWGRSREKYLVAKKEIEMWQNKCGEMQKQLETVEKDIEDYGSLEESEINGVASDTARVAEEPEVNKSESNDDVILISDDDEGNLIERVHSNSSPQNSRVFLHPVIIKMERCTESEVVKLEVDKKKKKKKKHLKMSKKRGGDVISLGTWKIEMTIAEAGKFKSGSTRGINSSIALKALCKKNGLHAEAATAMVAEKNSSAPATVPSFTQKESEVS